ncbi:hypothetical protein GCM10017687_80770 [Streptomyces echinatus]|uniref:acyl carrier protein n=1 Tax=Streptomyces echinatus TaxID=67293 RepID=UPI0031ED0EBB
MPALSEVPAPDDVERVVREVISERTGYPVDMIEPDLDLEADLSIDSIKRAEIAGELAQRLGIAGGAELLDDTELEELAKARTAAAVTAWLTARIDTAAEAGSAWAHDEAPGPETAFGSDAGSVAFGAGGAGAVSSREGRVRAGRSAGVGSGGCLRTGCGVGGLRGGGCRGGVEPGGRVRAGRSAGVGSGGCLRGGCGVGCRRRAGYPACAGPGSRPPAGRGRGSRRDGPRRRRPSAL